MKTKEVIELAKLFVLQGMTTDQAVDEAVKTLEEAEKINNKS
ncbi:hypothetical protein [Clostridium perfringens]|nr:hypothetical protein [Clostridium perfringens]MDB2049608.1 hypothetical protein [Clostridium perfringens]